ISPLVRAAEGGGWMETIPRRRGFGDGRDARAARRWARETWCAAERADKWCDGPGARPAAAESSMLPAKPAVAAIMMASVARIARLCRRVRIRTRLRPVMYVSMGLAVWSTSDRGTSPFI